MIPSPQARYSSARTTNPPPPPLPPLSSLTMMGTNSNSRPPVLSRRALGVAGALLFYVCASICLTMFNKWLFTDPTSRTATPLSEFELLPTGAPHGDHGQHDHLEGRKPVVVYPPPPLFPPREHPLFREEVDHHGDPNLQNVHGAAGWGGHSPYRHLDNIDVGHADAAIATPARTPPPATLNIDEHRDRFNEPNHHDDDAIVDIGGWGSHIPRRSDGPLGANRHDNGPTAAADKKPLSPASFASLMTALPMRVGKAWSSPYGFQFPLTVTCLHQLLVFLIAVVINRTKLLKAYLGEVERSTNAFYSLVPLGIISGMDWGFSNTSLRYVPLSLYEIIKASSPVIVLVLSLVLGGTRPSWRVSIIVMLISVGMLLSVTGGDSHALTKSGFPVFGFACLVMATGLSALRVVYTEIMLHSGGMMFAGGGGRSPLQQYPLEYNPLGMSSELNKSVGGARQAGDQPPAPAVAVPQPSPPPHSPRYVVSRVPPETSNTANHDGVQLRGLGGVSMYSKTISMLVEHRRCISTDSLFGGGGAAASMSQLDLLESGNQHHPNDEVAAALDVNLPLAVTTTKSSSASLVDKSNGGGGGVDTVVSSPPITHLTSPVFHNPNKPFNMLTVLYYSAPASCAVLIIPTLLFEGSRLVTTWGSYSSHTKAELASLLTGTSILAFLLAISEFLVTLLTSALTLCITGIAKQVLVIGLSMMIFEDRVTNWAIVGFVLSVMGIGLYNYTKSGGPSTSTQQSQQSQQQQQQQHPAPGSCVSLCVSPSLTLSGSGIADRGGEWGPTTSSPPLTASY